MRLDTGTLSAAFMNVLLCRIHSFLHGFAFLPTDVHVQKCFHVSVPQTHALCTSVCVCYTAAVFNAFTDVSACLNVNLLASVAAHAFLCTDLLVFP